MTWAWAQVLWRQLWCAHCAYDGIWVGAVWELRCCACGRVLPEDLADDDGEPDWSDADGTEDLAPVPSPPRKLADGGPACRPADVSNHITARRATHSAG